MSAPARVEINLPQNPGEGPHRPFLGLLVRQLQQILTRMAATLATLGTGGSGNVVNGTVSLAASPATFTDIVNGSVTPASSISLTPTNLYGGAEIGAGNLYATPLAGSVRIFHTASTKTRSFSYILSLVFLLFAHGALGQQVYCDGTPQEVRPKLNLINSVCTQDAPVADATNIDVLGLSPGGDMFTGSYATGMYSASDPATIVDRAEGAGCIDGDLDGFCNFKINVAGPFSTGTIDLDGDGNFELSFTPASITWFPSGTTPLTVTNSGQFFDGKSSIVRMGGGLQVGVPGTAPTIGIMSGIGREAATDRLFADRNTNFSTVQTREVNAASTNAGVGGIERYLENDNEQLRLTADYTNATTGGTEITGLTVGVNGLRTYDVTWHLFVKTSVATTGVAFGFDYSNGTPAPLKCTRRFPSTGVGAGVTGIEEDAAIGGGVGTGNTGQMFEYFTTSAESSAAPDMGPTVGFANATPAFVFEEIQCLFVTAIGAGNIRLFASAETANTITVMAGSWVNVVSVQ